VSETIFDGIAQRADRKPEVVAIEAHGRRALSYSGLRDHLLEIAGRLNALGVGRGDRVAVVLPSGPEMATACLAVSACAIATPLNPDFKQSEYEAVLRRMAPKLLLTLAGGHHPVRAAAKATGIPVADVVVPADAPAGVFQITGDGTGSAASKPGLAEPDDIVLLLQTSGTTSLPKIVPLTQRNLVVSATNLRNSLHLTAEDRCLHFLPLFHIGGIVDVLAAPLLGGGVVNCAPGFSSPDFFRDLEAFKPTWTQAVPVMIQEILANAGAHPYIVANHTLRFMRSVSAPLPETLMAAFEKAFAIPVIEIFGMTETAGVITSNPLPPARRIAGSVGLSAGGELRVVDATTRQPLSANQIGEVIVRGGNVMGGYVGDAAGNTQVFFNEWFRTGDLGFLNEGGYLFLRGRLKDMINRGGEKVSPLEVDEVLLAHPAIADAATFALPHCSLGEEVAAAVVLKSGMSVSKDELNAYLRERLAFFKLPRALHYADKIPRSGGGKLQRATLAEKFGLSTLDAAASRSAYVAPQAPVAKMLASMWSRILKDDNIGIDDDFFSLGGDSLKAASFINELQQKWGDTIYVSSLFDAPTIAKYERYLRQHYPDVIARMLGEYVAPRRASEAKVTPAMVVQLRGAIASPPAMSGKPSGKNPRAIFVFSPPRSGSTLLRAMLGGHPKLFAPPELYLLPFNNLADRKAWYSGSQRFQLEGNIRALMQVRSEPLESIQSFVAGLEQQACPTPDYYRMMQESLGDRVLVDKTPAYAITLESLQRAEQYFENPVYIHLLRHPYGMIRSFEEAKLQQLWYPRLVGPAARDRDACPYGPRQLAEMIWLILNENILEFLRSIPPQRQFRLKFEDVVNEPESTMREFCSRLDIEFAPDMLNPQKDQKQRMTDGIHDVSRMIGDPKFHQFKKIESSVADQWKTHYDVDFLSDDTWRVAASLGYRETVAEARGRSEIEI
jgi:oxalate---CoA ligase